MAFKDVFAIKSGTIKVLVFSIVVLAVMVLYSIYYYWTINRSVDPRVVEAKKAFGEYGELMKENRYDEALVILDKIEAIYNAVPGYEDSFELGVININKGSIYLIRVETEYLTETKTILEETLALYLKFAKEYTEKGVGNYVKWKKVVGKLSHDEIKTRLIADFKKEDPAFKGYDFDQILARRVIDIEEAQLEIDRRLSVSYTNLGVVARYEDNNDVSKKYYEDALKLWSLNHVAENNLRVLHGKEIKKRTIVEQLFPKERIEEAKENMNK